MKKTICLLLVVVMLTSICIPASATTAPCVEELIIVNENARTVPYVPTSYYNLSANSYTGTFLEMQIGEVGYTQRYFSTGTGELNLRFTIRSTGSTDSSTRYMKVALYKSSNGGSWTYQTTKSIRSLSTAEISTTVSFTNLELDAFYYIKVSNSTPGDQSLDYTITGVFVITE